MHYNSPRVPMSLAMSVCTPVYPYPLPISPYSLYTPYVPPVCLLKTPTWILYSSFKCSHDSFLYPHTLTLYAYATLMFLRSLSCLHAIHMSPWNPHIFPCCIPHVQPLCMSVYAPSLCPLYPFLFHQKSIILYLSGFMESYFTILKNLTQIK